MVQQYSPPHLTVVFLSMFPQEESRKHCLGLPAGTSHKDFGGIVKYHQSAAQTEIAHHSRQTPFCHTCRWILACILRRVLHSLSQLSSDQMQNQIARSKEVELSLVKEHGQQLIPRFTRFSQKAGFFFTTIQEHLDISRLERFKNHLALQMLQRF